MKKSQFTEEQIVLGLRQVELGTKVVGSCRKMSGCEFVNFATSLDDTV